MTDTTYWISDSELGKELVGHLKKRRMAQKFLYLWGGAKQYYGASDQTDSSKSGLAHNRSKKGFDYAESFDKNMINLVKGCRFALVSLGCGNSCQEKQLLALLIKKKLDFVYVGVDSSQTMLELSKKNLEEFSELKTNFICADFFSLDFVDNIKNVTSGYDMNIFSFLGGTFGNLNQTSITDSLYNILGPNDYVWFDCLSRNPGDIKMKIQLFDRYSSYLKNKNKNDFYLTPFNVIGVPSENGQLVLETTNEPSTGAMVFTFYFMFTKKTVVKFRGETLHFLPKERINLIDIRNYDRSTLTDFFKNHEFELINHEKGSIYKTLQVSHFVFRKK